MTPNPSEATHRVQQQEISFSCYRLRDTTKQQAIHEDISPARKEVEQALAAGVMDKNTGKILQYCQLLHHPTLKQAWTKSSANEFGRLAKGVGGRIKNPTETIRFIKYKDIPKDRQRDITYGSFVCSMRPEKIDEPNCTRLTVGRDKINYPGEVATPTAEMLVTKILFNSVISTRGAKFMTIDISNFYLNTPLKRPEYIRVKITDLPEPRRNHQRISTAQSRRCKRYGLSRSHQRHVWHAPSRITSK
jgi:hypothetical protein